MTMDRVILVDEDDQEVGTLEKMEAHRLGSLHRAFSIFLFNAKREVLLQKRAKSKYHSAGLWSNACCSHPRPEETLKRAMERKLLQEMGIRSELQFAFKFLYKTKLEHNLIEHEVDHVYTGTFDGTPVINDEEVEEWKFISLDLLRENANAQPQQYTYWLKEILSRKELGVALTKMKR